MPILVYLVSIVPGPAPQVTGQADHWLQAVQTAKKFFFKKKNKAQKYFFKSNHFTWTWLVSVAEVAGLPVGPNVVALVVLGEALLAGGIGGGRGICAGAVPIYLQKKLNIF